MQLILKKSKSIDLFTKIVVRVLLIKNVFLQTQTSQSTWQRPWKSPGDWDAHTLYIILFVAFQLSQYTYSMLSFYYQFITVLVRLENIWGAGTIFADTTEQCKHSQWVSLSTNIAQAIASADFYTIKNYSHKEFPTWDKTSHLD